MARLERASRLTGHARRLRPLVPGVTGWTSCPWPIVRSLLNVARERARVLPDDDGARVFINECPRLAVTADFIEELLWARTHKTVAVCACVRPYGIGCHGADVR